MVFKNAVTVATINSQFNSNQGKGLWGIGRTEEVGGARRTAVLGGSWSWHQHQVLASFLRHCAQYVCCWMLEVGDPWTPHEAIPNSPNPCGESISACLFKDLHPVCSGRSSSTTWAWGDQVAYDWCHEAWLDYHNLCNSWSSIKLHFFWLELVHQGCDLAASMYTGLTKSTSKRWTKNLSCRLRLIGFLTWPKTI